MAADGSRGATRLLHTAEKRSTLVYWPEAVDERLDQLQQLIMTTGEHASRAQILASLVMAAAQDGEKLARLVRTYRRRTVEEGGAALPPKAAPRRPGPRRPND